MSNTYLYWKNFGFWLWHVFTIRFIIRCRMTWWKNKKKIFHSYWFYAPCFLKFKWQKSNPSRNWFKNLHCNLLLLGSEWQKRSQTFPKLKLNWTTSLQFGAGKGMVNLNYRWEINSWLILGEVPAECPKHLVRKSQHSTLPAAHLLSPPHPDLFHFDSSII